MSKKENSAATRKRQSHYAVAKLTTTTIIPLPEVGVALYLVYFTKIACLLVCLVVDLFGNISRMPAIGKLPIPLIATSVNFGGIRSLQVSASLVCIHLNMRRHY